MLYKKYNMIIPMLHTDKIIDLYNKKAYDIIIDNLKIRNNKRFAPDKILLYAIDTANTDLIIHIFNTSNICIDNISHLMSKPTLYPTLEFILENNSVLCTDMTNQLDIYEMPSIRVIPRNHNIELLNIIMKYLSSDKLMQDIIYWTIDANNLHMIEILFEAGFNIKSAFDEYMGFKIFRDQWEIKFDTVIFLQKYDIDLSIYIDRIAQIFFEAKDLDSFKYCLEMGADVNHTVKHIFLTPPIFMIDYLINHGADLNCLSLKNIKYIIGYDDDGLEVITHLINNGLDVHNYLHDLILYAIGNNCLCTMKYFINLGADIHFKNDFLLFYSAYMGNTECVEILLEFGANIHADNDSILLFDKNKIPKKLRNSHTAIFMLPGRKKWFSIAKILIKAGATVIDPEYLFCLCVENLIYCPMDEELFVYLLDFGIDFNAKINYKIKNQQSIEYILEFVVFQGSPELVKLCLKYGADPHINNHSPLKIASKTNKLEIIKMLLDMGSVLDLGSVLDPGF